MSPLDKGPAPGDREQGRGLGHPHPTSCPLCSLWIQSPCLALLDSLSVPRAQVLGGFLLPLPPGHQKLVSRPHLLEAKGAEGSALGLKVTQPQPRCPWAPAWL